MMEWIAEERIYIKLGESEKQKIKKEKHRMKIKLTKQRYTKKRISKLTVEKQ